MRFEVPAGAVSAVLSILPLVIGYITTAMHSRLGISLEVTVENHATCNNAR
jgi:hypothetical protein